MEIVERHEDAAELPLAPLLVVEPLRAWLDGEGLGTGRLRAERIGGGQSNVTYLIERDGAVRFVLRRPPRPPLPPSAHDMVREAFVQRALGAAGARVPEILAVCEDESVLGVHFYVMSFVEGEVVTGSVPDALDSAAGRRSIGEELIEALVEIHAADWLAAGLEGFGKPRGYLERQVRRFSGLWEVNKTRELPLVGEVASRLDASRPDSAAATVVHGDYRLGNVVLAPGATARVAAVLDWELATIGDPLADLGYLVATWAEPGDDEDALFGLGAVTRQPGFPTRAELVARYEERTGRSLPEVRWYATLALWKSAVFLEGSYKRRLAGTTEDAFFDRLEAGVPAIAERAWRMATGARGGRRTAG